jgi:hypothetical protein
MTITLTTALASIVATLLGALIVLTWRSATLATKLLEAVKAGEERDAKIEARLARLDILPTLAADVDYMKKNHSLIPELVSRVRVLETRAEFSKEMRAATLRRSRPDIEE